MAESDVRNTGRAGDRVLEWFARVDGRYWAAVFTLGLLGYTLLMIVEATGYREVAALVPLVVGIPLVVLMIAHIIMLLYAERLGVSSVDLFENIQDLDRDGEETLSEIEQYRGQLTMIVWTAVAVLAVWLFGLLLGLVLFVFGFIYATERDIKRAFLATAITFTFAFLLFKVLLGAVLWQGVTGVGVVFS